MRYLRQLVVLLVFLMPFSIRLFIVNAQDPYVQQTPVFGEGKGTNLWGDLPPLKQYYEPPKQPVFRQPRSEKPIYDRIVVPSNPLGVIDLMNSATSILGGAIGAKDLPGCERSGTKLRYVGAIRLRVLEDGVFSLSRFDPYQDPEFKTNPDRVMGELDNPRKWKFLHQDEAIKALDAQLWYQHRTSGGTDNSYQQLFMGITGYKWHPDIHMKRGLPKTMMGGQLDPGGVYIDPTPTMEGKGGSEIRERVLKSRPSGETLSWPVDISETKE